MNNRKRKNIVVITGLLIATLITPIFASESQEKLNLRNFEETILITDMDINRAKKTVGIQQTEVRRVENEYNDLGDTDLETELNKDYNLMTAKKDLDYEYYLLETIEENVVISGKSNYFSYLLKEDMILLEEEKILRLKSELSQIETKISLGTAVESEKVAKELEITKEEFEIVKLEYELQTLALELNKALLWDLETTIDVFDVNVPSVSYEVEDIDAVVDLVLENHGEIVKLQEEVDLATMYYDIVFDLYNDEDRDEDEEEDERITDARKSIEYLKIDLLEKKLDVEYDVRSGYNSLLNVEDQFSLMELELENLEYQHTITEKRFDVGLEVKATLVAEEEAIEFAEFNLLSARLDYYIQVETFKALVEFDDIEPLVEEEVTEE